MVFIDQSGITTPFTTPQFPFIQNVQQKTQDSINAAFKLSNGPTVAPIALTPDAGLGQSVYTVDRNAGSGYIEQYNLAFQQTVTRNLSVEVAYVGSHIVHVGIPDSNLNSLTAAQLAIGLTNPAALTGKVTNPFYNQIPASSTLNTPTIAAAQLLKPYPASRTSPPTGTTPAPATTTPSKPKSNSASAAVSTSSSPTPTPSSSTTPLPSSPPPSSPRPTPLRSSPPTPSALRSSATPPPATCPT